jgi:hypothetical protein
VCAGRAGHCLAHGVTVIEQESEAWSNRGGGVRRRGERAASRRPTTAELAGYHAYHATCAELLRRLGCSQKSRAAYDKAIEPAGNIAETAYLARRREQLR